MPPKAQLTIVKGSQKAILLNPFSDTPSVPSAPSSAQRWLCHPLTLLFQNKDLDAILVVPLLQVHYLLHKIFLELVQLIVSMVATDAILNCDKQDTELVYMENNVMSKGSVLSLPSSKIMNNNLLPGKHNDNQLLIIDLLTHVYECSTYFSTQPYSMCPHMCLLLGLLYEFLLLQFKIVFTCNTSGMYVLNCIHLLLGSTQMELICLDICFYLSSYKLSAD